MILECPHCYNRVCVGADGRCPSCERDTNDVSTVDLSKAKLTLSETDLLPKNCFQCDAETEDFWPWQVRMEQKPGNPVIQVLLGLVGLGKIRLLLNLIGHCTAPTLRIDLPCCVSCHGLGRPEAMDVDFQDRRVTFLVNKTFRGRVLFYRSERESDRNA